MTQTANSFFSCLFFPPRPHVAFSHSYHFIFRIAIAFPHKTCKHEWQNSRDENWQFFSFFSQVFIGETLSARVSHLHIRPSTSQEITKTKSSGLCVSTGTGSTSWHTSINRMSDTNVEELVDILKTNNPSLIGVDPQQIAEEYNRRLVFEPGKI